MYGVIEYLMALHEVEKARLASQQRKNYQQQEGFSDREPAVRSEQAHPQTNSKEATACP